MTRSSPAMSEAYSEASSHYSCATGVSSSSAGTFQHRRRVASSATSTATRSTTASRTSDGLSYFTVETTTTEKQNRSWLEQFWAWVLTEEKDQIKPVEKRPLPRVPLYQSSFSDDSSQGSTHSDASELVSKENLRMVALETRNDEQEGHHENLVAFRPSQGRDPSGDRLQADDSAVKRSRYRVRPPTPRYAEHRSPTPEHSPSPVPRLDARSWPTADADSVNDDERSVLTNSKRSFRIGTGNRGHPNKHDLPPRPSSASTFGKRRAALNVRKASVATPLVSTNAAPPSASHPDSLDSHVPAIEIKPSPSNSEVKLVDIPRISSGISVKQIVQKIETAPSRTNQAKLPKAHRSPVLSSTKEGQIGVTQKIASSPSGKLSAKNAEAQDTRDSVSGHLSNRTSPSGSSRFRSLGARKRFGTPVFLRSASFDGVLTGDSFPSPSSRDDNKSSTQELHIGQSKAESRTTKDVRDNCIRELRCDDPVERSMSSESLAFSGHRGMVQDKTNEQERPSRTRIFGDKTKKPTGNGKEKHWSQFSGSAAVFLSLLHQKDDDTGGNGLTTKSSQHDIPRHTMSMDRYDATSSLHTQNTEISDTMNKGNTKVLTVKEPNAGKRVNVVTPGQNDANEKVLWTQLKAHRSFS